jgi:hypothetical protein
MRLSCSRLAGCVVLCILAAAGQVANGADLLGSPPPAAPGVELQTWFPNHPLLQFPLGEPVEVIIGVSNSGSEAYDVTNLAGSLHSSTQWKTWVQNFTAVRTHAHLKPGEQISLRYSLRPDPMLHVREFQVAIHVFYKNKAGVRFHGVAMNKTIDVIELPKWIDLQLLGLLAMFFAALAGISFLVYRWVQSMGYLKQTTKRRPAARVPLDKADSAEPSQWLKGTFYDTHARAKAKLSAPRVSKKAS